ncbi:MAG: hypothetical protein KatS3mg068_2426 [Candidatus Sericytochromatia bacterium]|nr:MAG: hypothetical protein KatS3mg068_2426 [Candidatus Sericytochromatia bacterium]
MERCSRYIIESKCGIKEKRLFEQVIKDLVKIAEKTGDLPLLTDKKNNKV